MSPETAYLITHMLRGVVERGHRAGGRGRWDGRSPPRPGRPTTTRTRGSSATRRAWPPGVWVGYDRPRSLGKDETGSRVAVPIWVNYMGKVLGDSSQGRLRDARSRRARPVDLDPSNECVRVVSMAFVRGTEPAVGCGPRRQSVPGSDAPPGAAPSLPPAPAPGLPQSSLSPPTAPSARCCRRHRRRPPRSRRRPPPRCRRTRSRFRASRRRSPSERPAPVPPRQQGP